MYHPGGFGNNDNGPSEPSKRSEPSILRPILCLCSLLLIWTVIFLAGVSLGLGWYAWPMGSVFLGLLFLGRSFFLRI